MAVSEGLGLGPSATVVEFDSGMRQFTTAVASRCVPKVVAVDVSAFCVIGLITSSKTVMDSWAFRTSIFRHDRSECREVEASVVKAAKPGDLSGPTQLRARFRARSVREGTVTCTIERFITVTPISC